MKGLQDDRHVDVPGVPSPGGVERKPKKGPENLQKAREKSHVKCLEI